MLTSLADAWTILYRAAPGPVASEAVAVAQADGRRLAEAVIARRAAPDRDISAMDGYALRADDVRARDTRLPVVAEIAAGSGDPGALKAGQCARIFTGAPVPAGADTVVIQEQVRRDGDHALFEGPIEPDRHIRRRGLDFGEGATLLEAGRLLDPRALMLAAASDCGTVRCHTRPRVAILASGDELVAPGEASGRPGALPESVSIGIAALARRWGADVVRVERLPDDLSVLEEAARRAAEEADLLVTTGGASVGARDFARAMVEPLEAEQLFAGVAVKPGKPAWFARLGRSRAGLALGLPGNPSSAMVTARLFLAPLLVKLGGGRFEEGLAWSSARLAAPIAPGGSREELVRAIRTLDGVRPVGNQDSSLQTTLARADALIRVGIDAPARAAGDSALVLDF